MCDMQVLNDEGLVAVAWAAKAEQKDLGLAKLFYFGGCRPSFRRHWRPRTWSQPKTPAPHILTTVLEGHALAM
jgi:hypothetical protein